MYWERNFVLANDEQWVNADAESIQRNQDLEWASKASAFSSRARNLRCHKIRSQRIGNRSCEWQSAPQTIVYIYISIEFALGSTCRQQQPHTEFNYRLGAPANINKKGATHAARNCTRASSVCVCSYFWRGAHTTRGAEQHFIRRWRRWRQQRLPRGARHQMQPIWRLLALSLSRPCAPAGNENCIIWWAGGRTGVLISKSLADVAIWKLRDAKKSTAARVQCVWRRQIPALIYDAD